MNIEKVLELVFKDIAGKNKTITVKTPREDVTKEEALAAMASVITSAVFQSSNGDLKEVAEDPSIRTTTSEPLA